MFMPSGGSLVVADIVELILAATALSGLGTRVVLHWLRRRQILDHPNERSSHTVATPRGGGWAVTGTLAFLWACLSVGRPEAGPLGLVLVGVLGLALVSWLDDLRGLSPGVRFPVQIAAVALGLSVLPADALVFQGWLPWLPDRLLAGFCWLWFVNLFNFMDGIDGIAGTETVCIGLGIVLVVGLVRIDPFLAQLAAVTIGAALGFLVWNWHPAAVFLGDVGSVPLGYALGWLLIALAAQGYLIPALILPLYFGLDATATLLRRLRRGVRIWHSHREHFYQQAVQKGRRHDEVVLAVLLGNLMLILCALAAAAGARGTPGLTWLALPPALAVVLGVFYWCTRPQEPA